MLDQINRINLLYDIYSSLLTERQQEILQLYFSENYSLGEIAVEYAVSRQAIHDLIRRSLSTIEKLENKLGLYKLFTDQQELLSEADIILSKKELNKDDQSRLQEIVAGLRRYSEQ